jgi:hypothetical protein
MTKGLVIICCVVTLVVLTLPGCAITGQAKAPKFVLRVNCAATEPYTDNAGNLWSPDQYFEQGKDWGYVDGLTVDRGDLGITGTDAPDIYETERYSMSAYQFKLPNGTYTVRLHFAETFYGITDQGQRVFSVTLNGEVVLDDFDPYKEADGFDTPLVKKFKGVTVTSGELVIGFIANIENPEINGIEIISE